MNEKLIQAVNDGNLEQVKRLISLGAVPTCSDGDACGFNQPLLHAISKKHVDVVNYLLFDVGVPVTNDTTRDYALAWACESDALDENTKAIIDGILRKMPRKDAVVLVADLIHEGGFEMEIIEYVNSKIRF